MPVVLEMRGAGFTGCVPTKFINCLGRRVTSYTTRDAKEIAKLLAMVP